MVNQINNDDVYLDSHADGDFHDKFDDDDSGDDDGDGSQCIGNNDGDAYLNRINLSTKTVFIPNFEQL